MILDLINILVERSVAINEQIFLFTICHSFMQRLVHLSFGGWVKTCYVNAVGTKVLLYVIWTTCTCSRPEKNCFLTSFPSMYLLLND